jgi:preprotein translocase subunit YajC
MIQLLQAATPSGPSGLMQFAPMIFIFVIFYFLLIAPMRKRQKKTQEMLSKLKKGDEVVTSGGIYGTVDALNDERNFVILRISENTRIKIQRSAIASLTEPPAPNP